MVDHQPQQVVWFLTGSQGLYGEDVLSQVAEQSRGISDALDAVTALPLPVVAKPVLTDAAAMRRMALEANEALPWATIDMDFMNLNQANRATRMVASSARARAARTQTPMRSATRGSETWPVTVLRGTPSRVWTNRTRGRRARATTCATSRSPRATRSRPSCASASR